MDLRFNREAIVREARLRYYSDPDFHSLVENSIMLTRAQPETIIPGMHEQIRETAKLAASFALILQEKVVSLSLPLPQPGEPTMNLLIDERTGKTSKTLAHLPTPGED